MKTFLLGFIIILSLQTKTMAATSTPEFVSQFVQKMNDRLEVINTQRALEGSRPYCAQLSDEQMNEIESLFVLNRTGKANQIVYRNLNQVPAKHFITTVSENLHCYPLAWFPGRTSIGGLLFNTKAYVMDHTLVRETLEAIAGRPITETDSLASLTNNH